MLAAATFSHGHELSENAVGNAIGQDAYRTHRSSGEIRPDYGENGLNFDLGEEQRLLRDMLSRFGADRYDPAKRLTYLREPDGFARDNWAALAEAGVLAFALPEAAGGFGGSDSDIIIAMETLGNVTAVEPMLACVIMGIGALWQSGTESQRKRVIPELVAGQRFAALAVYERESRYRSDNPRAVVERRGESFVLSGTKQTVLGGPFATDLVVSARADASGEIGLYLVDARSPGLAFRHYRLADGSAASDIDFASAPVEPMDGGADALRSVLRQARLAICAELVGLMARMFDETLEYLKTREQFGKPLGSFQAIQHRMADCYTKLELSRSQLYRAAGMRANNSSPDSSAHGAKAFIARNAIHIGEEAVQLHGGIGTTEELLVGQAFKRVFTLASLMGDVDTEISRYIALSGASDGPMASG